MKEIVLIMSTCAEHAHMCVGVCVCERLYVWVCVCVCVCECDCVTECVRVWLCVNECGGGVGCALIYLQNRRKFGENLWLFMDVLRCVRRILNNICCFLPLCCSFQLRYYCFLLLLVQFSSGVRAIFCWSLCRFRHSHTRTTNTYMHKNKCTHSHTHALTHAHSNPDSDTHIHTDWHKHTITHEHTLSHSHTHRRTHTHIPKHTAVRTHRHRRTCVRVLHMFLLLDRFPSFPPFQQF